MEYLVLGLFCGALVLGIVLDISMLWALSLGLVLFWSYGRRKGFSWRALAAMTWEGVATVWKILLTFLLIWGLTAGITAVSPGAGKTVNSLLWGFNFIIGSLVAVLIKVFLSKMKRLHFMERQYQNNYLLNRISGFAFDLMIVAGIASIELADLSGLWLPFVLLTVAGAAATWFYLAWLCKKVYPGYYYEGLMSMYGMLTGTISSGVLLLREIDPEYNTPAANNLVLGSSFGIGFGFPVLILVGMAPKGDVMLYTVVGICVVYLAILLTFIFRVGKGKRAQKKKQ